MLTVSHSTLKQDRKVKDVLQLTGDRKKLDNMAMHKYICEDFSILTTE